MFVSWAVRTPGCACGHTTGSISLPRLDLPPLATRAPDTLAITLRNRGTPAHHIRPFTVATHRNHCGAMSLTAFTRVNIMCVVVNTERTDVRDKIPTNVCI